jgi:hypothetical protein
MAPEAKRITQEYIHDSQYPIGPTLSKGTMEGVYMAVVFYIPFTIIFVGVFVCSQLWVLILASTSMLPSGLRDYTGRLFGVIERCVSYSR